MKKKIFIDPGSFYTKVCVLHQDEGEAAYKLFGRSFFPTAATPAPENADRVICHEFGEKRYLVGGDCPNERWDFCDESLAGAQRNKLIGSLVLRKVLFDYSDSGDEVELSVVVEGPAKRQVFEELCASMTGKLEVVAYRGPQKIRKIVELGVRVGPASDGVTGYVAKIKSKFDSAMFIDIGFASTKMYVVSAQHGVEKFAITEIGARFYSDAIMRALKEENIEDVEPYWLMKQVELGRKSIEVASKQLDVSLILENARWDTNKDFRRIATDFVTEYYNTTSKWVGLLVITGGGALFNGELLSASLAESGYKFDDIYIDKSPLYTVLEGLVS